jgi:hypothetical protein
LGEFSLPLKDVNIYDVFKYAGEMNSMFINNKKYMPPCQTGSRGLGGRHGRNKMADKKLSAYDVLSEVSKEDLIVALKSLGEGKYQNANVKLAGIAEALSKLNDNALTTNDLSNLSEKGKTTIRESINQKIENIENTKANKIQKPM